MLTEEHIFPFQKRTNTVTAASGEFKCLAFCALKNKHLNTKGVFTLASLQHRQPRLYMSWAGEKARRKFSSTGGKAPGYRLSPDHFQTVKRMLVPDWAQKMLCIIVPNRQTASPEFFSWVRTWPLLTRSQLVWLMHQRIARSQETFSLI